MSQALDFWERTASRYDRSMWIFGGPMPRTCDLVAEAVNGADRALELASGTGLVSVAVAPVVGELVATDFAPAMVERTRQRVGQRANVRCERADITALPYDDADFDAVVAANLLHLVPDLEQGLAEMRRVLKPGGILVVPAYCHAQNALSRLTSSLLGLVSFPARRRLSLASLQGAVQAAGFQVERAELVRGLLPIGFVQARRESSPKGR